MKSLWTLLATLAFLATVGVDEARAYGGGGVGGFHLGLSAFKYDTRASGDNFSSTSENSTTHLDAKVGYLADNEIYFGLIYSMLNEKTGSNSPERKATGVTLGYHTDGWFVDLSYFLTSEYKIANSLTYKEGTGFQAEFGYNFMMSSNFYLGLELAYKTISYEKQNTGGADFSYSNTFTELLPMFNLGFYF